MFTAPVKYYVGFGMACVVASFVAILFQQFFWLAVPACVLLFIWFGHRPVILFYVLIASIPWSVEFNFNQSLGTDLPDEPLMLLTSFSIVAFLIFFYRQRLLNGLFSALGLLLLLQFTWWVVSAIFSTDHFVSFKFLLAKGWYLTAFVIAPFILFKEKKIVKNTALLLAASMMVCTLTGFIRHAQFGFTFGKINESLHPFFRNHVNYSALLVCIVPLLFIFYFHSANQKQKSLCLAGLLLAVVAVLLSYSRGAWLALIVGAAAYWLLKKKWLLKFYLLVLLLVFAALFWLMQENRYLRFAHDYNTTVFHTNFEQHLVATYQLKDVSTAERFYRWIAGVRMIKDRWTTGYGPNTFYQNYRPYAVPAFKTWVSNNEEHSTVHNYFLLTAIEQGVMGLLLLLTLTGLAFYKAQVFYATLEDPFWKTTAAGVAIIIAMLCTVNFLSDLVETDKIGSVFYLCIATLLAMEVALKKQSQFASHIQGIS